MPPKPSASGSSSPRGVSGARSRPAASGHQGAQRDAGRRWPHRADGLRHRPGLEDDDVRSRRNATLSRTRRVLRQGRPFGAISTASACCSITSWPARILCRHGPCARFGVRTSAASGPRCQTARPDVPPEAGPRHRARDRPRPERRYGSAAALGADLAAFGRARDCVGARGSMAAALHLVVMDWERLVVRRILKDARRAAGQPSPVNLRRDRRRQSCRAADHCRAALEEPQRRTRQRVFRRRSDG